MRLVLVTNTLGVAMGVVHAGRDIGRPVQPDAKTPVAA
jgi:hypothetical protein